MAQPHFDVLGDPEREAHLRQHRAGRIEVELLGVDQYAVVVPEHGAELSAIRHFELTEYRLRAARHNRCPYSWRQASVPVRAATTGCLSHHAQLGYGSNRVRHVAHALSPAGSDEPPREEER